MCAAATRPGFEAQGFDVPALSRTRQQRIDVVAVRREQPKESVASFEWRIEAAHATARELRHLHRDLRRECFAHRPDHGVAIVLDLARAGILQQQHGPGIQQLARGQVQDASGAGNGPECAEDGRRIPATVFQSLPQAERDATGHLAADGDGR
jgi:hypothetical protein